MCVLLVWFADVDLLELLVGFCCVVGVWLVMDVGGGFEF